MLLVYGFYSPQPGVNSRIKPGVDILHDILNAKETPAGHVCVLSLASLPHRKFYPW